MTSKQLVAKINGLSKSDRELLDLFLFELLHNWYIGTFMLIDTPSKLSELVHDVRMLRSGFLVLNRLFGKPKHPDKVYRFVTTNTKVSTFDSVKLRHKLPVVSTTRSIRGLQSYLRIGSDNTRKYALKLTISNPVVLATTDYIASVLKELSNSGVYTDKKLKTLNSVRASVLKYKDESEVIMDTSKVFVADITPLPCFNRRTVDSAIPCLK